MIVEISKEAFDLLVSDKSLPDVIEGDFLSNSRKKVYNVGGTKVIELENFASAVVTYHVEDINA